MSSSLDGDLRQHQRTLELFPPPTANQTGWILPRQTEHIFFFHSIQCDFICIGISLPQLLIYISSQLSKWVAPIGFAPSMRQRPTQHFISRKPLSARRPRAHRIRFFFSLPVGSIYIRRENPLRPQSFQTHVKDSGPNWAVTHITTGGWWIWERVAPAAAITCRNHSGLFALLSGLEFRENERKKPVICYFNQSTLICKALNHI